MPRSTFHTPTRATGTRVALAALLLLVALPRPTAATLLDAPERLRLPIGAGGASVTLANISGDWHPEIVVNAGGVAAFTSRDTGWAREFQGSDNISGFASFEDVSFLRIGLYTNVSFAIGSAPILGAVFPDNSPGDQWRPVVFTLGSSNFNIGEMPGRFSHASISIGVGNEVYPPFIYVPVSGTPGRLYACDLWSIPTNGNPGTSLPFVVAPNARASANEFFNLDSRPDVAVACEGTGPGNAVASVLIRTSPTTFAPHVDYAVADGPVDIATGFFGSPRADLVVACAVANGVSYLRNHGDGTFASAVFYPSSGHSGMRSIHVADVNQDGFADIVVFYATSALPGGPGGVGVRFGSGANSFGPEYFTPTGTGFRDGNVADMNGDSYPDAIVSHDIPGVGDQVQIFAGRGDGRFGGALPTSNTTLFLPQPFQLALGDFDGDLSGPGPTDDVLISIPSGAPGPNLLLQPTIVGTSPAAVGVDFPEYFLGIAPGHFFESSETPAPLDILAGAAPPLVIPGRHMPLGFDAAMALDCDVNDLMGRPVAADLDGDGFDDAITAMLVAPSMTGPGQLEWRLNNGDGTFAPFQSVVTAPNPRQVLAADVDVDGAMDIVTIGAPNTIAFHRNVGGTLAAASYTSLSFGVPAEGSLGPNYYAPTHVAAVVRPAGPTGPLRLFVLESNPPRVAVLEYNGSGGFTLLQERAVAANPVAVASGDLDGDGNPDAIVACEDFVYPDSDRARLLTVWSGDNLGALVRRNDYDLRSEGLMDMQAGDLTGDGKTSIVTLSWGGPRSAPQDAALGALGALHTTSSGGVQISALSTFEPQSLAVLAVPPAAEHAARPALTVLPNPARARAEMQFTIARAGEVRAEAFDLSGRRVWASPRLAEVAGPISFEWNGRTNDGSRVNAGLYLVRVSTPDGVREGRVVWLR